MTKRRRVLCDPEEHKYHLCYLISHRRVTLASRLVGDGRYRCAECHRRAAAAENLCAPVDTQGAGESTGPATKAASGLR